MAKSKSEWRSISWWAFLGFGVSLAVHISTFFDIYISGIWILHIGLFFVWIPVFLVSQSRGLTSSNFFGRSSWIPGWGQGLLILACLYGLINFASFQANAPSKQPYEFNGKYMIQRDGTNYEISKQEYNHIQTSSSCGLFCILVKRIESGQNRRCVSCSRIDPGFGSSQHPLAFRIR